MPKATVSRRSKPSNGPPQLPRGVPTRPRDPRYRNNWELTLGNLDPNYVPPTDEEIEQMYGGMEEYNAWAFATLSGPGETVPVVGNRPNRGVTKDVYVVALPDSHKICIRLFPGGFEEFGQYFLEFFDRSARKPVRAPAGCEFVPGFRPGSLCLPGKLISWQQTFRVPIDGDDTEMYAVPEGTLWELQRPGKPNVRFSVPIRPQPDFPPAVPYAE
ncbi:hypothetical protein PLICRDRAFT_350589 [Plicaturopsis crispa FD-325 SS-3]|uniref:Uncharacterized protein n=1 Tax=Plicaturopsis crispa FD-325 SS-3 TaxID=944288 RepID=A0A0C9T9Q3_PLICR|nr:hypothetical protein PLICRDRAFT_350589 [Plicaturopsis crispa FD-325 SS-3]